MGRTFRAIKAYIKDSLRGNFKECWGFCSGLILVRKALFLLERQYFPQKAVAPDGKIVLFFNIWLNF